MKELYPPNEFKLYHDKSNYKSSKTDYYLNNIINNVIYNGAKNSMADWNVVYLLQYCAGQKTFVEI